MKIQCTPEQQAVVDHILHNDGILLVEAKAGTGKSTLAKHIVKLLKPKTGLYMAFNKSIVEEGIDRFYGSSIECKTFHALGYKYVKPQLPIQAFSYKCITEKIIYADKRKLIDALDTFFVSSATCMYDYFEFCFKEHTRVMYMTELAVKYVNSMINNKLSPTFNFLLKALHLMLVEKTVSIDVSIVILDEINDVTAVSLEIFKLITAPKKLGLGETNQAIYEFLNLVNGFEVLKNDAVTLNLTHSFRCSKRIAERIQYKMRKDLNKDFVFTGTDKPCRNGKTLYVTLTNSYIIDELQKRLDEGLGFTLLRKPADIFAAPLAVLSASTGKEPFQKKYAFLSDLYKEYKKQTKYKSYQSFLLIELNDDEITGAVNLLSRLRAKGINLFQLYSDVKEAKSDTKYTVSTVFTSKGMEYETVYMADDLNSKMKQACAGELNDSDALTIKRAYYVAASRAGVNLYGATQL